MNFEFFLAQRMYADGDKCRQVAKPAIRIAMIGMALGLAIMLTSICVVIGFKNEVRSMVIGFSSHIQISNFKSTKSYETYPIATDDSLIHTLEHLSGVKQVQRFSTKPGMIKTDDNFQGMVLKGVGQEYDMDFFLHYLKEGEIPQFTDTVASNKVLISRMLSDKLHLKLGDEIYTYYVQENVRARKLTIAGIYETNFSEYDNLFLIGDIYTVNRLNGWEADQVSGLELSVYDDKELEQVAESVQKSIGTLVDVYGNTYFAQTIEDLNPQLFAWLGVLDMNVWVILILMLGVAGFTMISGLLIIILERTNMIGVLKALGANDFSIRKIFLYFSVFIIGKGMLWGNVIGLSFCLLQKYTRFLKLDPVNYYLDAVPIHFSLSLWLLLNLVTLVISVLMLVLPSYLIARIHPAKSIRFE